MKDEKINNDKLISELNDVIVKNYDASKGFKNASEHVNNPSLKKIFVENSTQRSKFAGELQAEVRTLGGEPKNDSSALGAMHRGWMDIKSALSSDNSEAILEASITGEKAALKEYDDLLEKSIPNNVRNIVQTQRTEVNNTLQQIKSLEETVD